MSEKPGDHEYEVLEMATATLTTALQNYHTSYLQWRALGVLDGGPESAQGAFTRIVRERTAKTDHPLGRLAIIYDESARFEALIEQNDKGE